MDSSEGPHQDNLDSVPVGSREKDYVRLRVKSSLVNKNEKTRRYWAAIHLLIVKAIEEAQSRPENDEPTHESDGDIEEGQVVAIGTDDTIAPTTEEGEVVIEQTRHSRRPSIKVDEGDVDLQKGDDDTHDNDAEDPCTSHEWCEVDYSDGFVLDPTGLLTEVVDSLKGDDQVTQYTLNASQMVLGTNVPVDSIDSAGGFKNTGTKRRMNGCFNCGSVEHNVANCPIPLDRRRIAEAKDEFDRGGMRYHESAKPTLASKYPDVKQGIISQRLRMALGLKEGQEDPFVRIQQRLGAPSSKRPVSSNFVEQEPLLTLIDESTAASVLDTPQTVEPVSNAEEKPVVGMQEEDSLPFPNCKSGGSIIWRSRLLPICTCEIDPDTCLRQVPPPPDPSQREIRRSMTPENYGNGHRPVGDSRKRRRSSDRRMPMPTSYDGTRRQQLGVSYEDVFSHTPSPVYDQRVDSKPGYSGVGDLPYHPSRFDPQSMHSAQSTGFPLQPSPYATNSRHLQYRNLPELAPYGHSQLPPYGHSPEPQPYHLPPQPLQFPQYPTPPAHQSRHPNESEYRVAPSGFPQYPPPPRSGEYYQHGEDHRQGSEQYYRRDHPPPKYYG